MEAKNSVLYGSNFNLESFKRPLELLNTIWGYHIPFLEQGGTHNEMAATMLHGDGPERTTTLRAKDLVFVAPAEIVAQGPDFGELLALFDLDLFFLELGRLQRSVKYIDHSIAHGHLTI